jgi:hypothetical protein
MTSDITDNIALASVYRLHAVNFRLSAEALGAKMETKKDGSPTKLTAIPIYFLVSHSAELLLKSALLKRGFTDRELKQRDYRHNLSSLLAALQKKGVSVTSESVDLINSLHSQHLFHALRYTVLYDTSKKTYLPPLQLVFAMLDELLSLTRISTQGK